MAFLDPARDLVVVRLVYDGAAFAGKTTSLNSLAASLGRPLETPDEIARRTLFFDWLDYVGGVFEGRHIRCQVVGVPGQRALSARRELLLDSADVAVFVGDSTAGRFGETLAYLAELKERLAARPGPPAGIIFQANKRDAPGALPLEEIEQAVAGVVRGAAVVESVAPQGDGIRKAFVLAVRLALDRVRELQRLGQLEVRPPEVDSSVQLLQQIQAFELTLAEREGGDPVPGDAPRPEREGVSPPPPGEGLAPPLRRRPSPPGADVPIGMVWPPVEGRIALHQAEGPRAALEEREPGEWWGRSPAGWQVCSPPVCFPGLEAAREALLAWARLHTQASALISKERCLAASFHPEIGWRLWQCVREQPSLAEAAGRALREPRPEAAAENLLLIAVRLLVAAQSLRRAGVPLAATLETVGALGRKPQLIGLVPVEPPEERPETRTRELLGRHLAPRLAELACDPAGVADLLEHPGAGRTPWTEGVARELAALLRAGPTA